MADTDYDCPICYENFATIEKSQDPANNDADHVDDDCHNVELGQIGKTENERCTVTGCNHAFCRQCLTNHCKHAVSLREIPIRCPASASEQCHNVLCEAQIKDLLCTGSNPPPANYGSMEEDTTATTQSKDNNNDDDNDGNKESTATSQYPYWNKFLRFQKLLQNPSLIACSKCDQLLDKNENHTTTNQGHPNDRTCPHCQHQFCIVHGDAHPAVSCRDYQQGEQDKKTERLIQRHTKPCSHCGIRIHKDSGCDHIVCGNCNNDMCFKCGSHLYLSGDMVRSCSNCRQEFVDHRQIWKYRLAICLTLPLYIPLSLLYTGFMAALTLATCGCFCCFGCGAVFKTDEGDDDDNDTPKASGSLKPLLATQTVLAMIFLPVIDLVRHCGLECCCGLAIPGLDAMGTSAGSSDDGSDFDDAIPDSNV